MSLTTNKLIPSVTAMSKRITDELDDMLDGYNYNATIELSVKLKEENLIIINSEITIEDQPREIVSTYDECWEVNLEKPDELEQELDKVCKQAFKFIIKELIEDVIQNIS